MEKEVAKVQQGKWKSAKKIVGGKSVYKEWGQWKGLNKGKKKTKY
jgi:hypothetical protein